MADLTARRFSAILCGVCFSLMTTPGFAQGNLLTNPGFNSDLSGWDNLNDRPASWSSRDAGNSMSSGSVLIVNEGVSNNATSLVLTQCVSATPNTQYSFGGHLLIPAGQPMGTNARVFVQAYASGNCSGNVVDSDTESGSSVEEWEPESSDFLTDSEVRSIRFGLGVHKPDGEAADASGYFDNVFLRQTNEPGGFAINPSMSASWYNPDESGHGIMIHLLDGAQAWMCWFTFDLDGNPAWICALGTISGDTIVFADAFTVEGGNFPPLFDPDQIVEVPWGSITVTFTGCNSGMMTWSTSAQGFQSGSMPLIRLTSLWGNACP